MEGEGFNEINKQIAIKENVKNAAISRATPVFLTAVTTIGGILPLWLGQDPMFSSLAIAIIFGLLASVFITLLVAPALYLVFGDIKVPKTSQE